MVDDFVERPQSISAVLHTEKHLILDFECETDGFQVTFDAIERIRSKRNGKHELVPIHFCPKTPSRHDKTIAACTGVLLERVQNIPINTVKIIHGPEFAISRIKLRNSGGTTTLARDARDILKQLAEITGGKSTAPKQRLNHHCDVCRFQTRCFNDAVQRNDLSLLRGLPPNEILALNERGVFTVTQLAHTFRAKTMGRTSTKPKRHSQSLQAMAIRDGIVYGRTKPELPANPTRVFLDVEGIPDRSFDYLIGMLTERDIQQAQEWFWAESESEEESIWRAFCNKLAHLGECSIYHFGRYEAEFVKRMSEKYGCRNPCLIDRLQSNMVDIYEATRTNVFFPVYSNRLKDIALFLGSEWTGPIRSGVDSIVWRYRWEQQRNPQKKAELIQYNYEDCLALKKVTDFLQGLEADVPDKRVLTDNVSGLSGGTHEKFGQSRVAIPELPILLKLGAPALQDFTRRLGFLLISLF